MVRWREDVVGVDCGRVPGAACLWMLRVDVVSRAVPGSAGYFRFHPAIFCRLRYCPSVHVITALEMKFCIAEGHFLFPP